MRTAISHLRILVLTGAAMTLWADGAWAGQGRQAPAGAPPRPAALDVSANPTAVDVGGHERLAWDQRASSRDELAGLAFVAYVNGREQALASVSCGFTASAVGYECTAALPALEPGLNAIEVAAYLTTGVPTESPRSSPILLRFGSSVAPMGGAGSGVPERVPAMDQTWSTADGVRLRATVVADGLEDATDLLPLPDGRLLIAERAGRVRMYRDGVLSPTAGVLLDEVSVGDGRGLLALAADRAFSSTQHVFAIYGTEDGLRLSRFTVAGDRLVDRAVLLDGLPVAAVQPAAILRTGPDGRLYLALDDGGDSRRLGDRGSYSGKVLRLSVDGTTPADQPSPSPVWSVGVSRPIGLAWSVDAATPRLLGVESPEAALSQAALADAAAGGPVTRFSLTPDVGATRAAIGGGPALPAFRDSLIVASARERAILRVRLVGDDPAGTEWLVRDLPGPATALAVAADGTIYVAVGPTLVRIVAE